MPKGKPAPRARPGQERRAPSGPARKRKRGRQPIYVYSRKTGRKLPLVAPGPLTPRGTSGPPSHTEAIRTITTAERQAKALRLFVDYHLSYEQIGAQLGVSHTQIANDLKAVYAKFTEDHEILVPAARAIEVERTHRWDRQILPVALGQAPVKDPSKRIDLQLRAHNQLLRSGVRRAALQGLDAPVKIAPTDPAGERPYGSLSDEELDRVARDLSGQALPGLPDVPVGGNESKPDA